MSFEVELEPRKSTLIAWKDAIKGHVYRSGNYIAYASESNTTSKKDVLRAVSLVKAENLNPGDTWIPGEESQWQPMDAVLSLTEK